MEQKSNSKMTTKKLIFIALLIAIIFICIFVIIKKHAGKLDEQKLDSKSTSVTTRRDYYAKHVDSLVDRMNKKEKKEYYVTVEINQVDLSEYNEYTIFFLRNDNRGVDYFHTGDNSIMLPPGVYRILSCREELDDEALGEIAILSPGKKVTLEVNGEKNTVRITEGDGKITEVYEEPIYSDVEYYDDNPNSYKASDAPKLKARKLDTDKTNEIKRQEYYKKNVDDIMQLMSDEEKDKYCVTIHFEYKNETDYSDDEIFFIRNDYMYKGDKMTPADTSIKLSPGIYAINSQKLQRSLGEFSILTPGAEITMVIDYKSKSIKITEGKGKVTETN